MASGHELSLHEFLECYPPPQLGKVLEGIHDIDTSDSFDMSPDSVLEFHRKLNPNVTLSFLDAWGGEGVEHWIKVTVPIEFPGRFNVLPYDPASKDYSVDHIFNTVGDLTEAFPIYVQANATFGTNDDGGDSESGFKCGDRLKLLRAVFQGGEKVLECRLVKQSRLLRLPMHCRGDFTVVPDHNAYLLSDLVALPQRKRRVQQVNEGQVKIPGLPANFKGELFIEEADYFVEVSPAADRSVIIGLPHDLAIKVAPEDTMMERGQPLNSFATNNSNLFPLVARVTDWEEETTILENHYIKPGVELVVHGWTRQTKILAKADNQYYAIPLTYQGRFRIRPQKFVGVSELEKAHPAYKIKVVDVTSEDPDCPVAPGDILRIRREDSMKRQAKPDEIKYLKCEKFDPTGKNKIRDIKIPTFLLARFEEILEDMKASTFTIRELLSFVEETELDVELVVPSPDQKVPERDLPPAHFDICITLCDVIVESAVYVSVEAVDAPAFHVPLRTLVYVTFLEQLEKSSSPLLTKQSPKLSTLDRCVEMLPEEVYVALAASKQGGPEFPRFQRATAFGGPSSGSWQKESSTSFTNGSPMSSPSVSNGEPVFSMQQQIKATRMNHSTENLLQPPSPQVSVSRTSDDVAMTRSSTERQVVYDEFSFGPPVSQPAPPPMQNGRHASTLGRPSHVAVAHSDGGLMEAQFRSLQLSRSRGPRSVTSEDTPQPAGLRKHQAHHSSQPNLLTTSSMSTANIPAGYSLVAQGQQSQSPQQFQVPPGFALVPINQQQQAIPPGFMLVPYQQQQQQQQQQQVPLTMANVQKMHYATNPRSHRGGAATNGSITSDSDNDDAMTNFSKFTFSSKVFKVAIPQDGNLYHFSTKKMAELFRQLKIEEPCIRACLKDRIDGKKFSKMMEGDLERYGLMHPVVLHFRSRTVKKKHHFML